MTFYLLWWQVVLNYPDLNVLIGREIPSPALGKIFLIAIPYQVSMNDGINETLTSAKV